ncbi:MAG: DUF5103 domain-containing protein [Bacteroidales bacterium]|nr:DUF5103 domain-containing protein [Bacteroidales bacterium]MDD4712775.1 DUF5103 domain-containing protein [Bacteroidales bacterium]
MIKHQFFTIVLLLVSATIAVQAQVFRTGSHSEQIRSLTVYPNGIWSAAPVIQMGSDHFIEISFDELSHDYKRYAYKVIHCNADWTQSDMNVLEYLDGFSENDIEAGEESVSTLTLYTHYQFSLPNENVGLKLSGNYAVTVFDRDGSGEALLTACFMVVENKVSIEGSATATTDIDYKQSDQQLNFDIKTLGMNIQQPLDELKVVVRQNNRLDNEVRNIAPLMIGPGLVRYEHNKDLIFEGGNEYRRFEMTTFKYSGIGVNKIEYFNPYYHVELIPSELRIMGYVFDKDQNGRFLIHSQEATDDLTGSDYYLVHFTFPMEKPFLDGAIFLNGDFTENRLDTKTKMIYNFEHKAYEKDLLLKQGAYNYQYLYRSNKTNKATTLPLEGSYWETENEYQVYVYYRPIGERYDRLIGFKQIQTAF